MAGISSLIIGAGTALASAGAATYKTIQGNRQMKEAQQNIEGYQRQALTNTLEGIAVPQQSFNLESEQLARSVANAQDAAVSAGARGLSMLPVIGQGEFEQQQAINANLENNLYQLSLQQAQEDQRIRQMRENREREELAGYGAMYEAGRQTKYSGIGDVIQSAQSLGYHAGQFGGGQKQAAGSQDVQAAWQPLNAGPPLQSYSYMPSGQELRLGTNIQGNVPYTLYNPMNEGITELPRG